MIIRRRSSSLGLARHALPAGIAALALTVAALVAGPQLMASTGAPAGSPFGRVDIVTPVPGGLQFTGWAIDPDTPDPINVYVTVDGKQTTSFLANASRPDVGAVYPTAGPDHGYVNTVTIPEGKHAVCVVAQNVQSGADASLYCTTRTFDYGPRGYLDIAQAKPGAIRVAGWAYDPDQPAQSIDVAISIDGGTPTQVTAKLSRPDVAKAYPAYGALHGYDVTMSAAQGSHKVCVTGINIGYGSNNTIGCKTVTLNESPRGYLDIAKQYAGGLRVAGWAYDPDAPTTALTVHVSIDGASHTITANGSRPDVGKAFPGVGDNHGYTAAYTTTEGTHKVCVTVTNISYGSDLAFPCRSVVVNFTPAASLDAPRQTSTGITATGWASDPDTGSAIKAQVSGNGHTVTVTANQRGSSHSGHRFTASLPMTSGSHQVCAVGLNVLYGTHNSAPSCRTIDFAYRPLGHFDTLTRASGSNNLLVTGWAADPDTGSALSIVATVDGVAHTITANTSRPDVSKVYPSIGSSHGFSAVLPASDWEHRVCLTAKNVGGGSDTSLGCKLIIAVHPTAPSAPQNVTAQAGYGGATVTWSAPASDGGAPWSRYTITTSGGGPVVTVGASSTSAVVLGLNPSTTYTFSVTATNVAGTSAATTSPAVKTQAAPPPQTSPAPVSTSRYIRNISNGSASELAMMKAEGAADAKANPSGHGYLILLDIGGQDEYDGGVVLSATTRFVPYSTLVKDVQSYIDGYASAQKPSAPVTIAIGTNNDMDVSSSSGKSWADKVVDPLVSYAKRYPGIVIAGANDMEPGFRASYSATKSWLSGYLAATPAPFVFNGSADGCSWTQTNRGCNNGWTMSGLYSLAAGAAPIRILNLPQIYNTAMAGQWKYISLTGVGAGQPRIDFAGTLTEWTACDQTSSCGSLTGHNAWSSLWSNLQSDSRLKVGSLPYSTDLRIDK